jgi:hypothetical protein
MRALSLSLARIGARERTERMTSLKIIFGDRRSDEMDWACGVGVLERV